VSEDKSVKVEQVKKSNNTNKGLGLLIMAGAVVWLIFGTGWFPGATDFIFGTEIVELTPSDLNLYSFSDLHDNKTANIEILVINLGNETATNLSVYARCRNQNGTILYNNTIYITVMVLRQNETASGFYSVPITNTTKVFHTLEISWDGGRKTYQKTTNL